MLISTRRSVPAGLATTFTFSLETTVKVCHLPSGAKCTPDGSGVSDAEVVPTVGVGVGVGEDVAVGEGVGVGVGVGVGEGEGVGVGVVVGVGVACGSTRIVTVKLPVAAAEYVVASTVYDPDDSCRCIREFELEGHDTSSFSSSTGLFFPAPDSRNRYVSTDDARSIRTSAVPPRLKV